MTELSIRVHMLVSATVQSLRMSLRREQGQDLIEYAMLAGLIALALIGVGIFFQDSVKLLAQGIGNCIDFDNGTPCKPGF